MGQLPDEIQFDDWVRHVFDHSVSEPAWHRSGDAPFWNCDAFPEKTVEFINRLFLYSRDLPISYSPDQIGQGLWYLMGSSNYMHALLDERASFQSRLKCIVSINTLFEKCFATVCNECISHTEIRGAKPNLANLICYMFWDVAPLFAHSKLKPKKATPDHVKTEAACLSVMERTLRIPHDACQESALHGLGHWHAYYPAEVEKIIDAYVYLPESKRRGLRQYALCAKAGLIQ